MDYTAQRARRFQASAHDWLFPFAPGGWRSDGRGMIETLKKTLLAGVGAAVVTKEKVQDALDSYVREGKLKADDARIIAEKIAERGRREFDEMSQQLSTRAADLFQKHDASMTARLAALEARVAALEAAGNPPPTATRNGEP
jgi:polyhydroxyalkanoate synthesis regulator phasin